LTAQREWFEKDYYAVLGVPKDAPSNLAVVGRYVFTPQIFEYLQRVAPGRGGEIQLTDGIAMLLGSQAVQAIRMPGIRFDCGSKLGYLKATIEFGLRHPEAGDEFDEYLRGRLGTSGPDARSCASQGY